MTQDNTPPGPICKARLLHVNKVVGSEQGVVGEISPTAFRKLVVLVLESCLARSNRALKIGPGCLSSCVTYGK